MEKILYTIETRHGPFLVKRFKQEISILFKGEPDKRDEAMEEMETILSDALELIYEKNNTTGIAEWLMTRT